MNAWSDPEAAPVLRPDWHAPPRVQAFTTLRAGGVSRGPHGLAGGAEGGLNLGARCGDDPACVAENRRRLTRLLPDGPRWLQQVHGVEVWRADHGADGSSEPELDAEPIADAAVTTVPQRVLVILTADCLPVFFADRLGRAVGLAHAGWRGLSAGVLERTMHALRTLVPDAQWLAHIGAGIGPAAFEVGDDVRDAFVAQAATDASAFAPTGTAGKWWCNLPALARRRLQCAGVAAVSDANACTVSDPQRFYSHRRDRTSGRMASVIWLA